MKLLVLSSHAAGRVNDSIHRGFFDAFPGTVQWYGPGEACNFEPERPLTTVVNEAAPDLVLVNMKKRVVFWMDPRWLRAVQVPKACVEVDFCYEKDASWYRACKFDMTFFRGFVDWKRADLEKKAWLPFSVDPKWCHAPQDVDADVGFAGTLNPESNYPVRNLALRTIGTVVQPRKRLLGDEYAAWWRTVPIGLTCSSVHKYENAKHLIIPAAGALLLTDGAPGLERLFDDMNAYERYKPDCSDLKEIVARLLSDRMMLMHRRQTAAAHVFATHTHSQRWRDLLAAMKLAE